MQSVAQIKASAKMPHLEVEGNCSLSGVIKISGAKNSALVLMAASILTEEKLQINNIPWLTDIHLMNKILLRLGIKTRREATSLFIDPKEVLDVSLPQELVHSLRASFFCIGPLLARRGKASLPMPGGCQIGLRPIDQHIKGMKALGAEVDIGENIISARIKNNKQRLTAANIVLDCPSVGATETILMAACLAEGTTIIKNSAKEPEVQDLINMLNLMGAEITGAGTSEISIKGVQKLNGCTHTVIPDRIEAGTFLIAAAITRSPLLIGPVISNHLTAVLNKLKESGCKIDSQGNYLKIVPQSIKGVNILTNPFPGFPTDLQAPFMALMATANGKSKITETIFENRMHHVFELQKMGANIKINKSSAHITGVPFLQASELNGSDLRSTAAIILASLSAEGVSKVKGLHHLDRGYEGFEEKLNMSGASILRSINHQSKNIVSSCELGTEEKVVIRQDAA